MYRRERGVTRRKHKVHWFHAKCLQSLGLSISFHLTNLFLFIFFYNFFLPCMDFVWNMPIQEMKNQERDGFQTSNSTRFATIFGLRNLSPASCGRDVGPCSLNCNIVICMNPSMHKFLFFNFPFFYFYFLSLTSSPGNRFSSPLFVKETGTSENLLKRHVFLATKR